MPADHKPAAGAPWWDRHATSMLHAGVAAAALLGVAIRLLVDSPLWLDEALSANIAELPLADIGGALRQDGHPPLYYWLLHGWMSLFGQGDAAVRSLSLALSVVALPLGWALGQRVGGRGTAAGTTILLALSPYTVRYGTEARMYALVMVLVLVGGILVIDALERPSALRLAGIALVTAALVYTQYWSFYLLAAVAVVLAWRWLTHPEQRSVLVRILASVAVGGASFALWLPAFLDQAAHTGTPWSAPARPTRIVSEVLMDLGGGGLTTFAEGTLFGIAATLCIALSVLTARSADGRVYLSGSGHRGARDLATLAFVTLGVGSVIGYVSQSAFNSRYASVIVPFLLVLTAFGATRLPRGWPIVAMTVGLVGLGVISSVRVVTLDRTESGDVADIIAFGAEPGDVVVACPDQLGVSLERALRHAGLDIPVLPYPILDADPRFVDWRDYQERNDAADPVGIGEQLAADVDGAIWLVMNGSYKTFAGDCEGLSASIGNRRGAPEAPRLEPTERAFEHADVYRFGPPG